MDSPKQAGSAMVPVTAVSATAVQVQRASGTSSPASSPSVDEPATTRAFDEMVGSDIQRLSGAQVIALRVLLTGQGDTAAARASGKNPRTIGRWKCRHPVFRRCLKDWREAQRMSICDGLLDVSEAALDNVREAVLKGDDPRLSFAILRHLSGLDPRKIDDAPEDPPELPIGPEALAAWRGCPMPPENDEDEDGNDPEDDDRP